jgi:hypothetical protein
MQIFGELTMVKIDEKLTEDVKFSLLHNLVNVNNLYNFSHLNRLTAY